MQNYDDVNKKLWFKFRINYYTYIVKLNKKMKTINKFWKGKLIKKLPGNSLQTIFTEEKRDSQVMISILLIINNH